MIERSFRPVAIGDALVNVSRQMWLAGLGAAAVTRGWAESEGRIAFRKLVREGTAVESRAIRIVGDRLETSYAQANTLWKRARRTVTSAVRSYADTAASVVRETLPPSLPKVDVTVNTEPVVRKRTVKRASKVPANASKRAGRSGKVSQQKMETTRRG